MLKAYQQQNGGLKGVTIGEGESLPVGALWLDMLNPTLEERRKVDQFLGHELPTRADMEEIEISSRLYQEDNTLFMTAMVMAQTDTDLPTADAVTFVLTPERLVTIRYIDPQPFRTYSLRCERSVVNASRAEFVLMQILDAIIDRMADILEKTGADVEIISAEIFSPVSHKMGTRDFQGILRRLGQKHGLTSKMRESLLTIMRMLTFLTQSIDNKHNKETRAHVKTLVRDVQSLQDHSSFVATKVSYLQDGTLGLINNEQNNIIKIMSVASIVFLPPTLFASIWGMNFHHMPELDQTWTYPVALVIIVVSGILPYVYFKRRGWL
ncbi:MAG TPA: magnesium transporter CorA family protein [Micropepsaceae bacterium]|jgi:magnesium transporter|nr:magnesium transporter CorA family protein [Micropepsaceae bacterium]